MQQEPHEMAAVSHLCIQGKLL